LGSCSGIASEGYRDGQLQQTAGACTGAQNLLLGVYESLHNSKTVVFFQTLIE
jgi:hypothetical protein